MNSVQSTKPGSRLPRFLAYGLLALLILAGGIYWFLQSNAAPQGNLSAAAVTSSFTLEDDSGTPVTSASYDGKWRLMYFGYTFCPDVCPNDMAKLGQALNDLGKKDPQLLAKLQPLFITVDPDRDTPAALHQFTKSFHPMIVGLTGTPAQVKDALRNFRIYAAKVPGDSPDSYTMDHSALFYLMDPKGRPVEFMASVPASPADIEAMLERFLA